MQAVTSHFPLPQCIEGLKIMVKLIFIQHVAVPWHQVKLGTHMFFKCYFILYQIFVQKKILYQVDSLIKARLQRMTSYQSSYELSHLACCFVVVLYLLFGMLLNHV
ncbi:hypothetical protein SAY87_027174 [Trapa incisa]|uniref:Uncharacterized protein n=1 Tax=Trapa incisa TaxID=236973 RepID=A0AAN7JM92_9MYRT|nr:hypothetical protein SAY87_027174 [Trapa incisa]